MSIYYYLVCDRCRQYNDAASLLMGGGVCALGQSFMLTQFIYDHRDCALRVASEYDTMFDRDECDYEEPYSEENDPMVEADYREAELRERAQKAEAECEKLRKLYGSPTRR